MIETGEGQIVAIEATDTGMIDVSVDGVTAMTLSPKIMLDIVTEGLCAVAVADEARLARWASR